MDSLDSKTFNMPAMHFELQAVLSLYSSACATAPSCISRSRPFSPCAPRPAPRAPRAYIT
eukprot:576639-Lingulodinium_polyedra.AAC.1